MAKCIKKPIVRSGKLSNIGLSGSIFTRVQLLLFKNVFAKKEQKIVEKQKFHPCGVEPADPMLLNLPDRTVGFFIHFATQPKFYIKLAMKRVINKI